MASPSSGPVGDNDAWAGPVGDGLDPQVAAVVARTRRWIAEVVIGLNLCPFARRVYDGGLIRYAVTWVTRPPELLAVLAEELRWLASTPSDVVETSFLIHPYALTDFLDYNDFTAEADDLIRELGLEGVIQIAGFHPCYQFAGTQPEDVENYTNRSPYPMLHLLREDSISRVNDAPARLAEIPRRNIALLRRMGLLAVRRLLARIDAAGQSDSILGAGGTSQAGGFDPTGRPTGECSGSDFAPGLRPGSRGRRDRERP